MSCSDKIVCVDGSCDLGHTICCIQCQRSSTCGSQCNNTPDQCGLSKVSANNELAAREECEGIMAQFAELEVRKKAIEEAEDKIRAALLQSMENWSVKKFETDKIKVTYIAPGTVSKFDSKSFKDDHPDVYNQYTKQSDRKAYVTVKVK